MTFLSRSDINALGESLINEYRKKYDEQGTYVDIDGFVKKYLGLKTVYMTIAEDFDRLGFIADGKTPISIIEEGKRVSKVYPYGTVVIEKYLLQERECGRRRFTLAHEAAHYLIQKITEKNAVASYHREYDGEKCYSSQEIMEMMNINEWQADQLAAALLMPAAMVTKLYKRVIGDEYITVYGDALITAREKARVSELAGLLCVSFTALMIRLKELKLIDFRPMDEYVRGELNLGGGLCQ